MNLDIRNPDHNNMHNKMYAMHYGGIGAFEFNLKVLLNNYLFRSAELNKNRKVRKKK